MTTRTLRIEEVLFMKDIKYILICGAGLMGKNIAFVMASNPTYEVGVYDLYETDVAAGIRTNTKQLIAKGALTEEELASRLSRISFTTDLDSELVRRARPGDRSRIRGHEDQAGYLRQAGGALPSRHHLLHQLFRYEPQ